MIIIHVIILQTFFIIIKYKNQKYSMNVGSKFLKLKTLFLQEMLKINKVIDL